MADSSSPAVYVVVSNIPAAFRSADLRNYFSQFIEGGGFLCFHYRHRPEVLKGSEIEGPQVDQTRQSQPEEPDQTDKAHSNSLETAESGSSSKGKTCCCVVSVHLKEADRFVKLYASNQWIDSKGSWLARRCVIKRVKVSNSTDDDGFPYRTKSEQRRRVALTERFTEADLKALPELNPPSLMPSGNVGTTIKVFLQLIQSCRLPPRLIRKLGLTFPKTSCNRRYGNVPFQYHDTRIMPVTEESVFTADGQEISGPGAVAPPPSDAQGGSADPPPSTQQTPDPEEEDVQSDPDDDEDRCEEWERHEALHEDVTSQERCKERLYEEEIELKWEKGGSGLVFYTDAQYWQEEEGDFDEQTADDWDVDMSVYYDKDGGDMDSRDYVRMRYEKRMREGLEDRSGRDRPIGSFEKFTKGFGRRVMEQQGWKDGEGLGNSQAGIPDALENEGQHPRCKRGFGYHGEKLNSYFVKKARTDFHITTKYDEPKDIDQGDSLLRRQPTTSMKYREWQPGGSVGPKR
ncbi:G patch domain-containing protein 3 [Osmerus eperlanus]|uniref:G patch domain-containing protein 3 n=1 Tax=Osmerus eperlanus TaxID=29151 RepID=UPI002E0D1A51